MNIIQNKRYLIGLFGKYIDKKKIETNFQIILKNCKFYYLKEYEDYKKIEDKKLDIIISYGYGKIFKTNFFKKNKDCKIINFHIGYLPHGRGIYPNLFSVINNKKCGYSIHLIKNEKIDVGPLIYRKEVKYKNKDTLSTLFKKIKYQLDEFITKNLKRILQKRDGKIFYRNYIYNNRHKANIYFKKLPFGWNTSVKEIKNIKFK